MITLDDGTTISGAEHLAGIVEGTAETEMTAVSKVVSSRLNVDILARVDAFASVAGKSRNFMVEQMLEVGYEAAFSHLSKVKQKEVFRQYQDNIRSFIEGAE